MVRKSHNKCRQVGRTSGCQSPVDLPVGSRRCRDLCWRHGRNINFRRDSWMKDWNFFFSFFFFIFKHWFVIKRKFENDGINGISVNSAISTNKFAYDFHVTKNKQNCTPNIWNSTESIHKKTENVEEKRKKLIDSRPPAAPCSGRSSQLEPSAR